MARGKVPESMLAITVAIAIAPANATANSVTACMIECTTGMNLKHWRWQVYYHTVRKSVAYVLHDHPGCSWLHMAAETAPDWSGIEPDGGRAGCCVPVAGALVPDVRQSDSDTQAATALSWQPAPHVQGHCG